LQRKARNPGFSPGEDLERKAGLKQPMSADVALQNLTNFQLRLQQFCRSFAFGAFGSLFDHYYPIFAS